MEKERITVLKIKDFSILDCIDNEREWEEFFEYKLQKGNLSKREKEGFKRYIEDKEYIRIKCMIDSGSFPNEFPKKTIISKEGTTKKRIVYTFSEDINITLKFIAYKLYKYDYLFESNCYAFRRDYGVSNALKRILRNPSFKDYYCFKADISNYFNSINIDILKEMMSEIRFDEKELFDLIIKILEEKKVLINETVTEDESHGAMAGVSFSPFLANIYLKDVDEYFMENKIEYFRYSDDILIFAKDYESLLEYQKLLYAKLDEKHLNINESKVFFANPGDEWEFLGFKYSDGQFDLSENTKRKIKKKIKRKADALRRWQRKKGLDGEKAAIGFVRAMNRKFFGYDEEDDFTWSKWFFPNLTTDKGLKEIDKYMQEYIRYAVTGRHYKGNYRIEYETMKKWGYRNLVNEYYKVKNSVSR